MIGFRSWGSAPVSEVVAFLNDIPDDLRPLLARSSLPHMHACLMASYSGRFDVARDEYARAQLLAREVGSGLQESMSHFAGVAELLAGDPAAAERVLREGYDRLGELGAEAFRSTSATLLADALLRQGREEEVEELLDVADRIAPPDDIDPQVRSRALRARVLAGRGKLAEAERLAREAVDIVSRTDATVLHGDALLALAEVLRVAGADAESKAALRQALELYEHKENVVQAEQTRQMLATG